MSDIMMRHPNMWFLLARLRDGGTNWEPISIESVRPNGDRLYFYPDLDKLQVAFVHYLGVESGLPNVIGRLATGSRRFTDLYEVRIGCLNYVSELTQYPTIQAALEGRS